MPADTAENAVLAPWGGPHGGAPRFDLIETGDFIPALETGMAEKRAEVAAIVANPEPATFANTLEALEASGPRLTRATRLLGVYASTMNTPQMREVETWSSPRLAALRDEITHNGPLFARIGAVYAAREGLAPEQRRLAEVIYDRYVRQGAALSAADKARLAQINQELATRYTRFSQNILADEEGQALVLEHEADLAGLSPELIAAAAEEAKARGMPGKWAFANTRSAMEPFMTASARRDLREKAHRLFVSRADGGAHDNNGLITEILLLRAEKARLLGQPTFAHWIADGQMAKRPDAVMKLLTAVWGPARAKVFEEVAELEDIARAEGANEPIAPWDYRYYGEKVRKAKYDLDESEVKPYLQLERMMEGMFWAAGQLFGLTFTRVTDLTVYHPDVRVYEVSRDGARVGLWYFDPFARAGKRSGAWMNEYRTQQRMGGAAVTPIVSNNENYIPPAPGEPALISWTDAVTLFHEFGHGLHGMNSNVTYPSLAGTSVLLYFGELPIPLFEHLAADARAADEVRRALPDRRADAGGAGRQAAGGGQLPPGHADGGVSLRRHPRHEGAPQGRHPHRRGGLRARRPGRDRHAAAGGAAPPVAALLPHVSGGEGYAATGYYNYSNT